MNQLREKNSFLYVRLCVTAFYVFFRVFIVIDTIYDKKERERAIFL